MPALALTACGGAARSAATHDEQAAGSEPSAVDEGAPAEAPGSGVTPPESSAAAPGSPRLAVECTGVVDASGTTTIEVRNQAELDALAGCETIVGGLTIEPFAGVDLRPLASLRAVRGTLTLGPLFDEVPLGSFTSLAGLERLEAVAGLSLRGVLAPSLQALQNLQRFVPFSDPTWGATAGFLYIDHCSELTDLRGLERLEGLTSVVLKSNAKLTSLRGIQIPEVMYSLEVWESPVEDLGDVSRLTRLSGALWFNQTALQTAAGLEQVTEVDQLQFWGNAALRDLSALSALRRVGYLNLNDNPLLEALPAMDQLRTLTDISVTGNERLRELPNIPVTRVTGAWIENNASLERVLGLAQLRRVSQLRVAENPRLSVLELAQMQLVYDSIWVTNNPLLDDSALQRLNSLQSGRIRVGGNLGQPVPLAACPWVGDGLCDDTRYPLGICAEGTDPDCSLLGEE